MCDFSLDLVAWLDRELPPREAANLELHLQTCFECQTQIQIYRQLGETIDGYCETAIVCTPRRRSLAPVLRPALAVTAALTTIAATLLFFLLRPTMRNLQATPAANVAPVIAFEKTPPPPIASENVLVAESSARNLMSSGKTPRPVKSRQQPHRSAPAAVSPNWLPNPVPVYIAIPADTLFPPGALPEGVGFVADVNWQPDGSPQRLRLQPQLVRFEKRGTRP